MRFRIQAACGCHIGKIRKNNEDNFCFDRKCLDEDNKGLEHPEWIKKPLKRGVCMAVFDGMGGENFGEIASYAAASRLKETRRRLSDCFLSEEKYLLRLANQLNDAVVLSQQKMCTEKMGTTMVSLSFSGKDAYICNVGDSRAYRLRDGELTQISRDHIAKRPGREDKKAPLTQYLGFGSDEMEIEPHIAKKKIKKGDLFLLCSDGLSDMLTNLEISDMMRSNEDVKACAQTLIDSALEHGGRDNITVILCRIC